MEAYSGSRPARPQLLLLLSAGVLVATLALAAVQVQYARALGPRVRIPGVPLSVQPPRGWVADDNEPHQFHLSGGQRIRAHDTDIYRHIVYRYERRPAFVPLQTLLSELEVHPAAPVRPAQVAGLPGAEAVRLYQTPAGQIQMLLRVACSPRGDVVLVEYWPLADLDPGDLALMESLAAAVRIEDPAFATNPANLIERSGLELETRADWRIVGADYEEVPGFYVLGMAENEPAFALLVLRTWLAEPRTPRSLLAQMASAHWEVRGNALQVQERQRADGAAVATADFLGNAGDVRYPRVFIVSAGPTETVLIAATSPAQHRAKAADAMEWLAERVQFKQALPNLTVAQAAGAKLAAELRQAGLEDRWGRRTQESYAAGDADRGRVTLRERRAFIDDAQAPAFVGEVFTDVDGGRSRRLTEESWRITPDGQEYDYTVTHNRYSRERLVEGWKYTQRRAAGSETIIFVEGEGARRASELVKIGPAFIAPPAEALIETRVAHESAGEFLVERAGASIGYALADRRGPGTHTCWLRPLPPDAEGRRRALALSDYWPQGEIIARDKSGDLLVYERAAVRVEAVSEQAARRRSGTLTNID